MKTSVSQMWVSVESLPQRMTMKDRIWGSEHKVEELDHSVKVNDKLKKKTKQCVNGAY